MKKYITLTVLAFLTTLFYSCDEIGNNEEKVNGPPAQGNTKSTNPYEYEGTIHNELVDNYKDDYQENITNRFYSFQSKSYITLEAYNNMITSVFNYMVNVKGYSSEEVNIAINKYDKFNQDFGLYFTHNDNNYVEILKDFKGAFDFLLSLGQIDSMAHYDMMRIFSNTPSDINFVSNINDVVDVLETEQLANNWSNGTTSSFISVYRHSSQIWAYPITYFNGSSSLITYGLNPDQAIIAADAAGAAVGLFWGGIGSIIAGALVSMAEAEDQENGVSVLVGSEYKESKDHIH